MLIVGIDCATADSKVGLALGRLEAGRLEILEVTLASLERPAARVAYQWIEGTGEDYLVAFDAPLGWPTSMGLALATHRAGELIVPEPNQFFRRATDIFVEQQLRKRPLDVGADRIARTAHAALRVLHQLRQELEIPVPLAWNQDWQGVAAIEVYPAATLRSRRLSDKSYKKPEQREARESLLESFNHEMTFRYPTDLLVRSADALDAVACVLAGKDFVQGFALQPEDTELAQREGWIWTAPIGFSG